MALLNRDHDQDTSPSTASDLASRDLSVASYENAFVEAVYDKIAKAYDWTFGPTLHPGRLTAIQRMGIQSGDRILVVGVGTGVNLSLYPKDCTVTGVDYSEQMLEKARERVERKGIRNARLLQMDGADLKFADNSFDIVYAPYVISVVPDPVKVAREMERVCRPGGRIIILNHFLSPNSMMSLCLRLSRPLRQIPNLRSKGTTQSKKSSLPLGERGPSKLPKQSAPLLGNAGAIKPPKPSV